MITTYNNQKLAVFRVTVQQRKKFRPTPDRQHCCKTCFEICKDSNLMKRVRSKSVNYWSPQVLKERLLGTEEGEKKVIADMKSTDVYAPWICSRVRQSVMSVATDRVNGHPLPQAL